jgi:hypothetical protein
MLADELVQLGVYGHIVLIELLTKDLPCHIAQGVGLNCLAYIFLECVHGLAARPRHLISLCTMKV